VHPKKHQVKGYHQHLKRYHHGGQYGKKEQVFIGETEFGKNVAGQ